jgi:hypothetical protein
MIFSVDTDGDPTVNLSEINDRKEELRDGGMDAIPAWIQAFDEAIAELEEHE